MKLKLLNDYQPSPMSQEQTKLMMGLLLAPPPAEKVAETLALVFPCRVLEARLKSAQHVPPLQIDPKVILFLGSLCTSPGEAVLYAYTLKELAQANGGVFSFDDMIDRFPNGFPNREEMGKAWEAQKQGTHMGGNYLDTLEAWQHG